MTFYIGHLGCHVRSGAATLCPPSRPARTSLINLKPWLLNRAQGGEEPEPKVEVVQTPSQAEIEARLAQELEGARFNAALHATIIAMGWVACPACLPSVLALPAPTAISHASAPGAEGAH